MTDPFIEEGLPENVEAERSILGAILLDNSVCAQAIELLKPSDFSLNRNRHIFERAVELFQKQWPIEFVTLSQALKQAGQFEEHSASYISGLTDGFPRTDNIEYYAQIVIRKAVARALIAAANHIQAMCFDDPDREDLDSEAQRMIFEAVEERGSSPWVHLGDAAWKYLVDAEERSNDGNKVNGLNTGLKELDFKLWGLQRQDLIILAGRTSEGKTTLAFDITKRAAKTGALCAYFSMEQNVSRIAEKGIASEARLNSWRMQGGGLNRDEWSRASFAAEELKKLGVYVCDQQNLSSAQIRGKLHRLRSKQKKPIDLIVIDYLGLMKFSNRRERRLEVGDAAAEMKRLAKEFDAPLMLLHQLSRETVKSPEPELHHLAQSGDVENHTDVGLFIYKNEKGETWLKIGKNRNGPVGKFPVLYIKEQHRFDNVPEHTETAPLPYKDN